MKKDQAQNFPQNSLILETHWARNGYVNESFQNKKAFH